MKKIRIKKRVLGIYLPHIFENTFENVISKLKELFDDLTAKGWTDLKIERLNDDYGNPSFILYGINIETDEEYEYRKYVEQDHPHFLRSVK